MKDEIKYQDWPEGVKLATAFTSKKFFNGNYKVPLFLGYILLFMGIFSLIYDVGSSSLEGYKAFLEPLSFIIIGLVNLASGRSIKWIVENSSWEERFANTSSMNHKIINLLISVIIIVCLISFFRL